MSIKLIVFDLAGTTVEDNQNVAEALQLALKEFGYEVSIKDVNVVMGYAKPVAIRLLLEQCMGKHVSIEDPLVEEIHQRFIKEIIHYYESSEGIKEKDEAGKIFRMLKDRGVKVALDTGFSRNIANVIFNRLGWEKDEHYDVSITSDEVENGRPHPDMIYRAMELLQIPSTENVAKVGDTSSDLQEGSAAGCRYVIGITTGAYTEEELKKEKHTHLVSRLVDVVDIISE